jgi:hypothetical protein
MDQTTFLIALSAITMLYVVGWLAISLPGGRQRETLRHARLKIRRAIVALAAVPFRTQ